MDSLDHKGKRGLKGIERIGLRVGADVERLPRRNRAPGQNNLKSKQAVVGGSGVLEVSNDFGVVAVWGGWKPAGCEELPGGFPWD